MPDPLDLTGGGGGLEVVAILRRAFDEACAAERIRGALVGPPEAPRFRFADQESASGELILRTFLAEAARQGLRLGPELRPPPLGGAARERAAAALRRTVARIRALLVEYNSYLSAGLPFVFVDAPAAFRERGLAVYRYPAGAPARVSVAEGRLRIELPAGDLGEVTSTGFYVPTVLVGDFRVAVRYAVGPWEPGAATACLGLFAQDEGSLYRFYAQVQSARGEPLLWAATFQREQRGVLAGERSGQLELRRTGRRVQACAGGKLLGDWLVPELPERVVVGCKLWSHGPAGGLGATVTDFRLAGAAAAEQPPLVRRPDPRGGDDGS